jgi:hypothetical protein
MRSNKGILHNLEKEARILKGGSYHSGEMVM